MNILITNDDGINAEGIKALALSLQTLGTVFVVAPDREKSATGHGITVHHPLRVHKTNTFGENVYSWCVDGTPADCVKLALQGLLDETPDLVVSGINYGPNLGTDVLYSGTVSAAIEGIIHDIPSVAISLACWNEPDFSYAAKFANKICRMVLDNKLTCDTLLNVNVPPVTEEMVKDVVITKLGNRRYENCIEKRIDPRGRTYYWMAGEICDINNEAGTDIAALEENKISVTPIHFDLTNYKIMEEVRNWGIKK